MKIIGKRRSGKKGDGFLEFTSERQAGGGEKGTERGPSRFLPNWLSLCFFNVSDDLGKDDV